MKQKTIQTGKFPLACLLGAAIQFLVVAREMHLQPIGLFVLLAAYRAFVPVAIPIMAHVSCIGTILGAVCDERSCEYVAAKLLHFPTTNESGQLGWAVMKAGTAAILDVLGDLRPGFKIGITAQWTTDIPGLVDGRIQVLLEGARCVEILIA